MRFLTFPIMLLAGAGFLVALAIHLGAILDVPIPEAWRPWAREYIPGVLGAGIFVVWLPTVLLSTRIPGAHRINGVSWSVLLRGCPVWMRNLCIGVFIYGFINFFVGISTIDNASEVWGETRIFTGHYLIFYGAAFAVMFSIFNKPEILQPITCSQGHEMGIDDAYCPVCGRKREAVIDSGQVRD